MPIALARLPGLGPRSARKAALALLKRRDELLVPLAEAMQEALARIVACPECGNLDTVSPCSLCRDPRRDRSLIVVVEEVGDLWALERAGVVDGLYHVIGGHLSPLDGIGPDRLNIGPLLQRAGSGEVSEVVLALEGADIRDRDVELVGDPGVGSTLPDPRANLVQLRFQRSACQTAAETTNTLPVRLPSTVPHCGRVRTVLY